MHISRLQLRNYRAFDELDMTLEPATLLVGANDAGKSSILSAVQECIRSAPSDQPRATFWRSVVHGAGWWDIPSPKVVTALVTLSDLTAEELEAGGAVLTEASTIKLGRLWSAEHEDPRDPGRRCVVMDESGLTSVAAAIASEDTALAPMVREEVRSHAIALDDEYWVPLENLTHRGRRLTVDEAMDWASGHQRPNPLAFWEYVPEAVVVPGPGAEAASIEAALRPIIRDLVRRRLASGDLGLNRGRGKLGILDGPSPALPHLQRATAAALMDVNLAFDSAVQRFAPQTGGGSLGPSPNDAWDYAKNVIDRSIGELIVSIRPKDRPITDDEQWGDPTGYEPIYAVGAGTQRAALLACLDLYRDETLWPRSKPIMLLIEEPEMGLHPGAQRDVAKALKELPTFGPQTIVVTHSPTIVRSFDQRSIRLAHFDRSGGRPVRAVFEPEALKEVGDALGIRPSDVLIARRFVVVEGKSDCSVLSAWATKLDLHLEAAGVQLVDARGESIAKRTALLIEIAYPGTPVSVVLDGGKQTEKTAEGIRRALRDGATVERLSRDQIEAYFTPNAVMAWLALNAKALPEGADVVYSLLADGITKKKLDGISLGYLNRHYQVDVDGRAIALIMREEDIDLEVRELLLRLVADLAN